MKLLVVWCVCVLVVVVRAQEEEGGTPPSSDRPKPVFKEPSYPEGDVYFVETFTNYDKVWTRFVSEFSNLCETIDIIDTVTCL